MPIARIITSMPCRTAALAERLRAFGYTVETVEPGQETDGRADLEVSVSEGKTAEMLKELAARQSVADPDVYIAAGALSGTPLPAQNAPQNAPSLPTAGSVYAAGPPTIADTMNGVAAGLQNKRDLLAKALREQRAMLRQARIAERQKTRQQGVAPAAREWAFEPEQLSDNVGVDSRGLNYNAHSEPITLPEESGMPAPGAAAWVGEALPNGSDESQHLSAPQEFAVPAESPQEEYSSAVADGVAAEPMSSAAIVGPHQRSRTPRRRAIRILIPGGRHMSRRAREWRAAVLISCLFAGLLMLGWAAVTREPVSPLPKSLTTQTGLEEALPFGAATLKPTASAATIPAHEVTATSHAATAAVADAGKRTNVNPRPAADKKKSASQGTVRKQQPSRSAEEDEIAEDEVIIHHRGPAPAIRSEKASLKRFSD